MCVKLMNGCEEKPYDLNRPLEDQIQGCEQIVVHYEPFDKSVDKLVEEMHRFAKMGIDTKIAIKVVHNDYLNGLKTKKRLQCAKNDIALNEIIKLMVLTHKQMDQKLEELANAMGHIR